MEKVGWKSGRRNRGMIQLLEQFHQFVIGVRAFVHGVGKTYGRSRV
jgi:hypothetical protein